MHWQPRASALPVTHLRAQRSVGSLPKKKRPALGRAFLFEFSMSVGSFAEQAVEQHIQFKGLLELPKGL
jgi:hypothetical protein